MFGHLSNLHPLMVTLNSFIVAEPWPQCRYYKYWW